MAVLSAREILPRSFTHRFGEAPTSEIRYAVTVDGPTAHQDILNYVGIFHGSSHPEFSYLFCTEGQVNESDRYNVECIYRYEVPPVEDGGGGSPTVNPLFRPDVWQFSTGGAQVPALRYYEGSGNDDLRPLVNAANDFIEGLTTLEAEVRATITSNRATFPAELAAAVTNCVNASPYLWGGTHTWFCSGISASPGSEVVAGIVIRYWTVTVELVFRASGFNLELPHVGLNCLDGSSIKPCRVRGPNPGDDDVAASTPQALNTDGTQKYPPGTTPGLPDIITRRIYRAIDFATYFGTPPSF